jgi:hypothetical protein
LRNLHGDLRNDMRGAKSFLTCGATRWYKVFN